MFDIHWVRLFPPDAPLCEGQDVTVLAKVCGVTFLNACRVVYTLDSEERFGFAYGTLEEHAERGEERFCVERNPTDDSVWYDLYSFSRPSRIIYRAAGPVLRGLQQRFALHSLRAMQRAVAKGA